MKKGKPQSLPLDIN